VLKPEAMLRVIALARDSGVRPIFMRVQFTAQRDFLQTLPDVLVQGWAIAQPSVLPAALAAREDPGQVFFARGCAAS